MEVHPQLLEKLPGLGGERLARVAEAYARWPRDAPPELASKLAELLQGDDGELLRRAPLRPLPRLTAISESRSFCQLSYRCHCFSYEHLR